MISSDFYNKANPQSLQDIAEAVDASVANPAEANITIHDIGSLTLAGLGFLSYYASTRYLEDLKSTKASACLVRESDLESLPAGVAGVVTNDPQRSFALAAGLFYSVQRSSLGLHRTAVVDESARLEDDVSIGPGTVVGPRAIIGAGTEIGANVTIGSGVTIGRHCQIASGAVIQFAVLGDRVLVQPNAAIGGDGFGFASNETGHLKIPQLGRVIIQNSVEVGAGTMIDRGTFDDTIVGEGTKIDNLVQIGHNCVIGRHCVIVAMVGLGGSTKLGDFVVLGAKAGSGGHLTVGDGAQVAAKAGITKSLAPGGIYGGYPAKPVGLWRRELAALSRLGKKR